MLDPEETPSQEQTLTRDHGGNIQRVLLEFGLRDVQLVDFSTNVNPRGLPPRASQRIAQDAANLALLQRYPDVRALELRRALSAKHQIGEDCIVIGAGAAELLAASIRALHDREFEIACVESNKRERSRVAENLTDLGFRVYPSAANFLFMQVPAGLSATQIWSSLITDYYIHLRNCDSFEGL